MAKRGRKPLPTQVRVITPEPGPDGEVFRLPAVIEGGPIGFDGREVEVLVTAQQIWEQLSQAGNTTIMRLDGGS